MKKDIRKQLNRMRKSGKYIFVMSSGGYKINGILQFYRLEKRVLKNLIRFNPLASLKEIIVIEK